VDDSPPGIRRVCIAVDVERDGGGNAAELAALQRQMAAIIAQTCSSSGLDRLLLTQQSAEDAEIIVLPAGIDEPRAVTALVTGLAWALHQINAHQVNGAVRQAARIRLKMVVHEGITILAAGGFAGRAVTKTCRLLASSALHAALAGSPRSDLVVLLSDQVFEDIGGFSRTLPLEEFERVEIEDPARGARDVGWVFAPAPTG
jgi:hypothetical protein